MWQKALIGGGGSNTDYHIEGINVTVNTPYSVNCGFRPTRIFDMFTNGTTGLAFEWNLNTSKSYATYNDKYRQELSSIYNYVTVNDNGFSLTYTNSANCGNHYIVAIKETT